ncbi:response regulator with -like aaa-type and dna-binding domains : Response regulator with CheY-like receiver, AAA-type ATPase, and DNA-binding domains OS=Singulisphaera acidiphila (strain ATCC BAA-1392 / DSM 18658 / VKM B-2454 / MOB10) GN=Sinac_7189 PE=4 SV=1: Response_reg: Sigma54_activat: HTH_8 [Gemmata massiliana]|uniref:DNA-binding transcriptional regulator NtrC n=1 Tax=Gemmata massiliana TaxID=1210884 RepID=A0A6P2DMH2_9BACT|nr:sigma-54 dependent transcriptional regulator [Gemmata massiliana]VTS03370.1 response regulator with -like aaa-type and dna-binding domains : Response regulator with CheY-like receiver, AAA-type ATPase, and DNA-binding domains OS=Singulisphaera acidiphila (strain ATCC BAA-1392 / DSM 18658 / VKM B-2454 / MOB10) GN=Sinac_7189 PE=4 SV=1: Response_reg: Sigma54_activat: HTH_8 [Gemmata massiliana]
MPRVLMIDDEPELLQKLVRHALRDGPAELLVARSATEGLALAANAPPDVVLLDMHLPDGTGLDVFRRLRAADRRTPVVFITGSAGTDTAIEAMKEGAFDYLFKPVELEQLKRVVAQALEVSRLVRQPAILADTLPTDDRTDAIIGRCPAMREVYKAVGRVADQNVAVLITGESGTGKEVIARAIYQHGRRATGPFLALNCAAIPENLLESELFGHEKGAFTGADRRRIGRFEQAHGGTIFLDEIGDMPLATQAKMLRVLQDQAFERVGGNETISTDVRVLAATNRDLPEMVARGLFRGDLYYRLGVFTVALPPLRERGDDLPLLVRHYLGRYSRELGREVRDAAPDALEILRAYPWPGNVRELQSVLKQALLLARGELLLPAFLPGSLRASVPATGSPVGDKFELEAFVRERLEGGSRGLYAETVSAVERVLLPLVLKHTGGNQVQAAEVLGITRKTLRARLRELGLTVTRAVERVADDDTDPGD